MSTGFNAGIDSSDVIVRYGEEVTWDTVPAVAFQEIRLTGESLSEEKTRARPEEIKADGFVSDAITTQVVASGGINFALSYGTYDDLLAALINGTFSSDLAIQSVATTGIITATTTLANLTGPGFSTNDTGLFDSVTAGQWIRVSGFTAGSGANNGLYRVTAVDTVNDEVQVSATAGNGPNLVADASTAAEVNIQGSYVRNGTDFRSFALEKQLAANLFLLYSGAYIADGNLNAQVGGFLEGTFNFLAASETNATSTAGTGPATAAPTGLVIDTVAGFQQLEFDDTPASEVIQGVNWTVTKNNARAQYGLGTGDAQGMARGTIDVTGTVSIYFLNFNLYQDYKNETKKIVSFAAVDDTGAGYVFTIPGAKLLNPTIVAGGPDTDIVSDFDLEGNRGTGVYDGVIIQIDKIPAPI